MKNQKTLFQKNLVINRNGKRVDASVTITNGFSDTNRYAVSFRDSEGGFTNYYKTFVEACNRVDQLIKPDYVEVV